MADKEPPPSKAELEQLKVDRANDLPTPEPTLRMPGPLGDEVIRNTGLQQQQNQKAREARIDLISDRLAAEQDRARDAFTREQDRGPEQDREL